MSDSHETLKAYIQKVLSIQDPQTKKLPTQAELKAIALEIGLDLKDWEALQKTFSDHLTRGKGFIEYDNWDDAIEEFQQACAINPSDSEASFELARAYGFRWLEHKKEQDLKLAEKYARICINLDPQYEPAIQVLSDLKRRQSKNRKSRLAIVIMSLLSIVIVSVFLVSVIYFVNLSNSAPSSVVETPSEEVDKDDLPPNFEDLNDLDVAVEYVPGKYEKVIFLQPYSSDFNSYDDAYSYDLKANLKIETIEVEELKLNIELIDDNGQVIHTDIINAWEDHNPTARSGDLLAFGYLEHTKSSRIPILTKARISVQSIKASPAPNTYDPSPEIKLTWTPSKPSNVDLIVRKRLDRLSDNILGGVFNYLAFEVENTGNTNIQGLKFQLQWYDKTDQMLISKDLFIVTSRTPPLLRGQARVEGGTYGIENIKATDIKELEVIVADINY